MDNDKAFAAYALALLAGIASVVAVLGMSGASIPSPLGFAEHVLLALGIRAAYKSLEGWNSDDWAFTSGTPRRAVAGTEGFAPPDGAAGAKA